MMFALNAVIAVLVGGLTCATVTLAAFVLITQCANATKKKVAAVAMRVAQVGAICGFVGAVIMQCFGLWIT